MGERSWETFGELVEFLPKWGAYRSAILEDDVLAQQILEANEYQVPKAKSEPPSFHYFTPEQEQLVYLANMLTGFMSGGQGQMQEFPVPAITKHKKTFVKKNLADALDLLTGGR